MKKIFVFVIPLLVWSSCENKKQYFQTSREIDLAKKHLEDYQNRDWEGFQSLFADSALVNINTWWGDEITGEELTKLFEEHSSALSEISISADSFYEMIVMDDGTKWVHCWALWEGSFKNGNSAETVINFGWLFDSEKVNRMTIIYNSQPLIEASKTTESEVDTTSVLQMSDSLGS